MLAAMMSVTSMYSFAAQGAENETEQETGIEQESETQAEEAVDPMSADQILMRARKFEVSEILNAYFGEGKWDENLITSQESLASERNEYDGENRKLWIVQTGVGFLSITITYKDEVPDEKVRLQEGEDLLQTLNINIMDEYMKQTDFVNDDRSVYTYYLQQDGIKISPEGYSIGSEGDETDMTQILQNFHCSYKELVSRLVQANTNDLFVLVRVNNQPQPPSTPRKEECSRPLEGFLTPNPVKTNHLREFSDQIREFHSDNVSPPINDRGTFESCE